MALLSPTNLSLIKNILNLVFKESRRILVMRIENRPVRGVNWVALALFFTLILAVTPVYLFFFAFGWTWRGLTAVVTKTKGSGPILVVLARFQGLMPHLGQECGQLRQPFSYLNRADRAASVPMWGKHVCRSTREQHPGSASETLSNSSANPISANLNDITASTRWRKSAL